jgi:hypothetical protein
MGGFPFDSSVANSHVVTSFMVIADLNLKRVTIFKSETNAPLIINSYGVLPFTIIRELMQFVSRWNLKVIETSSQIHIFQLP